MKRVVLDTSYAITEPLRENALYLSACLHACKIRVVFVRAMRLDTERGCLHIHVSASYRGGVARGVRSASLLLFVGCETQNIANKAT
jgi:hypothetical protein